jgi:hypothetical protein
MASPLKWPLIVNMMFIIRAGMHASQPRRTRPHWSLVIDHWSLPLPQLAIGNRQWAIATYGFHPSLPA